ncbi:MAG: DUF2585 family protein [Verrucomicrobiales bacterium]|nr:DUF2585 family protein [Verrucomicrobiales bacterium]
MTVEQPEPPANPAAPDPVTNHAPGALDRLHPLRWVIVGFAALVVTLAGVELAMGRSWFGPDGQFGWWSGDIWSSTNSQRVADAYSFSHIAHGILFYAALWLVARKLPVRYRFLIAALIEACWEVLENSPIIINRYREATIALGYTGDSILNSCSDLFMMATGFLIAWKLRPWMSVALLAAMEIGCLFWVRDNLTLNIIMLIHPIEAIKIWQMGGQPPPG